VKVLFLDFDGVLNSRDTVPEFSLDDVLVARVNRILSVTGAKVVISSSWRAHGLPYCIAFLENAGFKGEVIGATPFREREWGKRSPPRGLEIQDWMDANPGVERFVILDDEGDMEHLLPFLIRTSMVDGLQDSHVDEAVRALKSASP
jgi:hypothetical protein